MGPDPQEASGAASVLPSSKIANRACDSHVTDLVWRSVCGGVMLCERRKQGLSGFFSNMGQPGVRSGGMHNDLEGMSTQRGFRVLDLTRGCRPTAAGLPPGPWGTERDWERPCPRRWADSGEHRHGL